MNTIKNILAIIITTFVLGAACAKADVVNALSATGTTSVATVLPPSADPSKQVVVKTIAVSSDKSMATLKIFNPIALATSASNTTTSTNLWVDSTNGFATGVVLRKDKSTGTWYPLTCTSIGASNIGLSATTSVYEGDQVYSIDSVATSAYPISGTNVNVLTSEALFGAKRGHPAYITLDGTVFSKIGIISGKAE